MEPDVRQVERKQTFKGSRFLVLTADANVTVSLPKIAPVRIGKTAENVGSRMFFYEPVAQL
jgi:hypothetical protein